MTDLSVSRRSLIVTGAGVSTTGLAGCYSTHPPAKYSRLVIYPASTPDATSPDVERRDSTWVVHLTLVNHSTIRTDAGNFHGVRVVAYSRQGSLVCSKRVGTVTHENRFFDDGVTVRMECSSFPYEITATARESPCNATVEIQMLRYDDERDVYRASDRKCPDEQTRSDG